MSTQLLNATDVKAVAAGLHCIHILCKVYRFKAGEIRAELDHIVALTFPRLLEIGSSLASESSLEAAEMLRTVVKTYKKAIVVGF